MKPFMDKDFLLSTPTAQKLYHEYAADMPIIDYHCHVSPREIFEDRRFENITQVWLGGDHYKWRVMRSNGVEEKYITGDAPDREKFQKFAEALPRAIGNPMYHWCHLELKKYFGYEGALNGETAEEVWNLCNEKLKEPGMSVRGLIAQSNVAFVGTTDDPVDSLEWHQKIKEDPSITTVVAPSFRPDKALNIDKAGWKEYIAKLAEVCGCEIKDSAALECALASRIDHFDAAGCRASDHGLDYVIYRPADRAAVDMVFSKGMNGEALTVEEVELFKTDLLLFCGREYAKRGWVMQLHYGCRRNNNTRMFHKLGRDTGYDAVLQGTPSLEVAAFLDLLASQDALPRMVLYSLNPNDDEGLNSVIGCFQDGTPLGRIQQGSAWWFNDHKAGMVKQLTAFANGGLLGNFIGMLTDSRSFLSYPRHEYFRRLLCNLLGGWVENGEYPADFDALGELVSDVGYRNAMRFFGYSE